MKTEITVSNADEEVDVIRKISLDEFKLGSFDDLFFHVGWHSSSKAIKITMLFWYLKKFCHITTEAPGTGRLIKSPALFLKDKHGNLITHIAFASWALRQMGIKHFYCLAKCNGRDQYSHIYIVVPKDEQLLEGSYPLDFCLDEPFIESEQVTFRKYILA